MGAAASSFYVTGGTLPQDAPCYVERRADRDLYDGLLNGEFCYVLTSRQMGKSSLMVRTAHRLRIKGANVVSLDLTAVGQNLTPEQWYDGLAMRMGHQLRLEAELDEHWAKQDRVSPVQRFMSAIRDVVMVQRPGPLAIFVDEIDAVRSLPFSTDEFFSAIRECYNRRTEDADLNRLTFCLLGVATPSDLIRDTRTTPFNIGRRVELNDFAEGEAAPLANGLGRESRVAARVLERILHWTGGHPYLSQRLCQAIAEDESVTGPAGVDRWCEALFLSNRARERDDNLLFVRERLLRNGVDLAGLLGFYGEVLSRKRVPDAEANPLAGVLRLSGIVRVAEGFLSVRNRIYQRVFDREWVRANMPDQELRRQRAAFRRGLLRGAAVAAVVLIASLGATWFIQQHFEEREARQAVANFGAVYSGFTSYQDVAEVQWEFGMEGTRISTSGSVVFAMQPPNKLNFTAQLRRGIMNLDVQLVSDGQQLAILRTDLKQYVVRAAPASLSELMEVAREASDIDMVRTIYGFMASGDAQAALARHAPTLRFLRKEMFAGAPSDVIQWTEEAPDQVRQGVGDSGPPPQLKPLPITAWVGAGDGLVRQVEVDHSQLEIWTTMPNPNSRAPRSVQLHDFVTRTRHSRIRLNETLSGELFVFVPPKDAEKVEQFDPSRGGASSPPGADLEPQFDTNRWSELIPPRNALTPATALDLSPFYNAPLTEPWHSLRPGNDLSQLPRGWQSFGGTGFDVRGIVQLAGRAEPYLSRKYPSQIASIPVGLKCRRLHFLHGTGWSAPDGTVIGHYRVHFVGGQNRFIPIVYGFEVRNWWTQANEPAADQGLRLAWSGSNESVKAADQSLRLYQSIWENPLGGVEVQSIDFVSALADPAPFLIAITAE